MQPPQGPWGNAPPMYQPPQGAPGGYPMPGGYPPPAYGPDPAAIAKLNDEVQSWLIITGVLWLTGLLFLAGPLAWWKANDLKAKYASYGVAAPSNVGSLRLVGILTTVLAAVLVLVIGVMLVAGVALALRTAAPH